MEHQPSRPGDGGRYPTDGESHIFDCSMAKPTIQQLRDLGPDSLLYSLKIFLASTKRRADHERYRAMTVTLVQFLQEHELVTHELLVPGEDAADEFTIRIADLTDDGLRLYRDAEQKWLRAIDCGIPPTDTSVLSKTLASIRVT